MSSLAADATIPFSNFEQIRIYAAKFCRDRSWEKFHRPPSIAMALAGECGEICEIFQWKGELDSKFRYDNLNSRGLTTAETVHLGEEIADVFIYSTRLCDICGVDFAEATSLSTASSKRERPIENKIDFSWKDVGFSTLATSLQSKVVGFRSPRHLVFYLQQLSGAISSLFANYSESVSTVGLPGWDENHKLELMYTMGEIGLGLLSLASMFELDVGYIVARKFKKNEMKYPVVLSRGSSAKYTAYETKILNSDGLPAFSIALATTVGIVLGICICNRRVL